MTRQTAQHTARPLLRMSPQALSTRPDHPRDCKERYLPARHIRQHCQPTRPDLQLTHQLARSITAPCRLSSTLPHQQTALPAAPHPRRDCEHTHQPAQHAPQYRQPILQDPQISHPDLQLTRLIASSTTAQTLLSMSPQALSTPLDPQRDCEQSCQPAQPTPQHCQPTFEQPRPTCPYLQPTRPAAHSIALHRHTTPLYPPVQPYSPVATFPQNVIASPVYTPRSPKRLRCEYSPTGPAYLPKSPEY